MQPPAIPDDEDARLSALRALAILDTPVEARFERLARLTARTLRVPLAAINFVDRDRSWSKAVCTSLMTGGLELPREVSFCGHAILGDDLFVVRDARSDHRFADNPSVTGGLRACFYAGRPITAPDGQRVGTLCVFDSIPRELAGDDNQALEDLAMLVETLLRVETLSAMESSLRARLQDAERRAAIDPLTRLWNRATALRALAIAGEQARVSGHPLSLAMIDLDHFKRVNDVHGHLIGDRALIAVADAALLAIRSGDTLARYGGEELLLVLPDCRAAQAVHIAERVRRAIAAAPITSDSGPLHVTASIGVCSTHAGPDFQPEALIKAADAALYRAKANGRNRVETDTSGPAA